MFKLLATLCISLMCMGLSFAYVVPIDADLANHGFIGAAGTKVVDAIFKDDVVTFWTMTTVFVGKELLDRNGTGFSFNDLVFDYAGFALIKFNLEF